MISEHGVKTRPEPSSRKRLTTDHIQGISGTAHADAITHLRLIRFGDDQFRSQYRADVGWGGDGGGTCWC